MSQYERCKRWKEKNREKVAANQRRYRKENGKETYVKSKRIRRLKYKEKYREFMQNQSCEMCGISDYRVLCWHHRDPTIKKDTVCAILNKNYSWDTIMAEVAKCQCLCHNCHIIVHNYS